MSYFCEYHWNPFDLNWYSIFLYFQPALVGMGYCALAARMAARMAAQMAAQMAAEMAAQMAAWMDA